MAKSNSLQKKSLIVRALDSIERAGNALPSPATIFLILTIAVMIISAICAKLGVSVTYETIDTANGNAIVETTVSAVNLLSVESIRDLITKMVTNFTSFFALGTVFTIILGVSVADGSGMLSALLRKAATSAPRSWFPWARFCSWPSAVIPSRAWPLPSPVCPAAGAPTC